MGSVFEPTVILQFRRVGSVFEPTVFLQFRRVGSVFEPTAILQFRRVGSVFEPTDNIAECSFGMRSSVGRTTGIGFSLGIYGSSFTPSLEGDGETGGGD